MVLISLANFYNRTTNDWSFLPEVLSYSDFDQFEMRKKSIKLYKAIKTKFNSTLFSLNKKINKFNVRFKSFFSVCFDNYYKILFIMIRLEMYKSNLKLNMEGGDVFFFPPDVHTLWRPKVNNTCLRNIFKNEKRMFVFRIRHIHWIIQGHCAKYPGPF